MNELHAQLEHYLKVLRLPGVMLRYRDIADQAAQKKLYYDEYLTLLLETEVKRKQDVSIKTRIAKARFPYVKTIEEFDFSFQPSLNEKDIARLGLSGIHRKKGERDFPGTPGCWENAPCRRSGN